MKRLGSRAPHWNAPFWNAFRARTLFLRDANGTASDLLFIRFFFVCHFPFTAVFTAFFFLKMNIFNPIIFILSMNC